MTSVTCRRQGARFHASRPERQSGLARGVPRQKAVFLFLSEGRDSACTKEACGFRDSYEDFLKAGAEVIGVSGDAAGQHKSLVRVERTAHAEG